MLHLTDNHGGDAGAAEILHGFQRAFQRDEAFLDDRRGNRAGVFQCEATGGKLIGVQFVLADCFDQRVVITHRQKIDRKNTGPLDVGIGVRVLVKIAKYGEEGRLVPVEAAPAVKTNVRLAILFPCRDGK